MRGVYFVLTYRLDIAVSSPLINASRYFCTVEFAAFTTSAFAPLSCSICIYFCTLELAVIQYCQGDFQKGFPYSRARKKLQPRPLNGHTL